MNEIDETILIILFCCLVSAVYMGWQILEFYISGLGVLLIIWLMYMLCKEAE